MHSQPIEINCPACSKALVMETRANQQCDAHDWHAQAGDSVTCTDCRLEWVAASPPFGWSPHNREDKRDVILDRCNDVILLVETRRKR